MGRISKIFAVSLFVVASAFLTGCSSISKDLEYFQGIDNIDLSHTQGLYDARIMPKDEITINVKTSDAEISRQFSLYTNSSNSMGGGSNGYNMPYLVENDGTINFPLVGRIKVDGLTKRECEDKIAALIKPYLAQGESPVVTVNMSNYQVVFMGEVRSPGIKRTTNNKMTLVEGLAMAGDFTEYGRKDNVLIIREDAKGVKSTIRIDLNDPNFLNSPYYYLQQNDIVYVTPLKLKGKSLDFRAHSTFVMMTLGFITSLSSLAIGLFRK